MPWQNAGVGVKASGLTRSQTISSISVSIPVLPVCVRLLTLTEQIVLLLFAWTVRTVTVAAVQPCYWRDKWSQVKDRHRITFTPPLFSQHVLLNLPSEASFTQVTAPLWVLVRAPSGSWESGTCNRRCSFWRSSIRRPKRSGFAGGRRAPFVCPATAAFPHLSVSDSALWVNGNLIPGVRSLIHRLLSLRCHSLATEPWFSAWKLKWEEKGFSSSGDDWSVVGVGGLFTYSEERLKTKSFHWSLTWPSLCFWFFPSPCNSLATVCKYAPNPRWLRRFCSTSGLFH